MNLIKSILSHVLLYGFILISAFGILSIFTNVEDIHEKVDFKQAIEYKDAVLSKNVHAKDSLDRVMNVKTRLVGVVFIQHSLGLLTTNEENRNLEIIVNN